MKLFMKCSIKLHELAFSENFFLTCDVFIAAMLNPAGIGPPMRAARTLSMKIRVHALLDGFLMPKMCVLSLGAFISQLFCLFRCRSLRLSSDKEIISRVPFIDILLRNQRVEVWLIRSSSKRIIF